MKQFRFRLEGLLRMRKIREDRCRQELAERRSAVAEVERELAALVAERQQAQAAERREGALEMTEVLVRQRHLNTLKMRAVELAGKRNELAIAVRVAQERLATARREHEIVERLKERQYEEYQVELRREEQANTDETARQLYATADGGDA